MISFLLVLLCIAMGFSWNGCLSTLSLEPQMSRTQIALATASTSICVSAIGLAFLDRQLLVGLAVIGAGAVLAWIVGKRLSIQWSLLISAIAFAIYMHGVFG